MSLRFTIAITSALVAGTVSPTVASGAQAPPDAILGEWCTQREENRPPGRVKFVRAQDGTYTGILSFSTEPKKDANNKDPKLRDRPLVGIVLMWHLRYEDGEYVDGYVYNPEDGGTYRLKAEVLSPESLKIRGYLGISLLGQTKTWLRYRP
ncbi:MAG: DUF2147 domain-containing protein [Polyangiaceae bacterium]|jgi:uncharacterized protein (DUF2147 family)